MKIYDFKVEYQDAPIGLTTKNPRFSWKLDSAVRETVQKSYYIQVIKEGRTVWDSTKIETSDSILVPYAGEALEEESRYQVKLAVESNHGEMAEAYTSFETGVFDPQAFQAKMITHDFPDKETACPVFYRRFRAEKKAAKA